MRFFTRFGLNIRFAALFCAVVILPDYVFSLFNRDLHYLFDPAFIAVMFVFGFALSFCGKALFTLLTVLFTLMQLVEQCHIAYFGTPINPFDISKIFGEFGDVAETGASVAADLWYVPVLVVASFVLLSLFYYKNAKKLGFSVIAVVAVCLALCIKPERASRKTLKHFLPSETRYSFHNALNSFSFWLVKSGDGRNIEDILGRHFYKPYEVKPIPAARLPKNIVLIMGESLTSLHMGALGYDRPTTPRLSALAKDPHFGVFKTYSGAVSTHAALPLFFNLVREPGNIEALRAKTANLFRLAKKAGYETHFISTQDAKQTRDLSVPHIDHIVTKENDPFRFARYRDEELISRLKSIDLKKGGHFVVLNFRAVHSPYEKCYENASENFERWPTDVGDDNERRVNAYDNAVAYTDAVIGRLFDVFKASDDKTGVFVMTSDHGQLLGKNGKFGHNILEIETAEVPFIFYGASIDPATVSGATHYDIGKSVARMMGFEIVNPNEEPNVRFVHGNNLYKDYQFIRVETDENGRMKSQETGTVGILAPADGTGG